MSRRPPRLGVWLYGTRIATLTDGRDGGLSMAFDPEAGRRWPINATVLSVTLPIAASRQPHPARVAVVQQCLEALHAAIQSIPPGEGVPEQARQVMVDRVSELLAGRVAGPPESDATVQNPGG